MAVSGMTSNCAGRSNKGEITEILGHIALTLFTNYFNHVAGTEVDFPAVAELEARA